MTDGTVGTPDHEDAHTVTVDAGSRDGITREQTVLDGDGLVGRVIRVTRGTATILLLSSSVLLATCAVPKAEFQPRPFMVICLDVEDYTSPASAGMDDIPKWLAETMTDVGVTGSFFVIGEKARSLEARGRQDVIEAMGNVTSTTSALRK